MSSTQSSGSTSGGSQSSRRERSRSPVKMTIKTLGPTVRNRNERKQLNGYTCKECEDYYKTRNLSGEELKDRLKDCSRHRGHHSPPKSPDHFWDTHFPTTPECIRKGYMKVDDGSAKQVAKSPSQKSKRNVNQELITAATDDTKQPLFD